MRKKNFITGFILLFLCLNISAQSPLYKIFLVGDAGDDEMTNQTLDSLKSQLQLNPNSAVFFLGDNSYRNALGGLLPMGFKGFDSSLVTQRKVRAQLDILNNYKGSAYFVPGNHDWWNIMSYKRGKPKLKMEENFIEQNLAKNTTIQNPNRTYLPQNGMPGPAQAELDNGKIKVLFVDTYWLILAGFKKTLPEDSLVEKTFYSNLDSLLADATARKQKILIVSHHPPYSKGFEHKHKGFHYPRRIEQSLPSFPAYSRMSAKMNTILKKYPGIYYAAGHIHAIEYFYKDNIHYIISGAGSKTHKDQKREGPADIDCHPQDCFIGGEKGFFELDFYKDYEKIIIYYDEGKKRHDL